MKELEPRIEWKTRRRFLFRSLLLSLAFRFEHYDIAQSISA